MKIIIPVSERDIELAEHQAKLILDLGGVAAHSCLLVVAPNISHRDGKIASTLQKAFGSFDRYVIPNIREVGGPTNQHQPYVYAANSMFKQTVLRLAEIDNREEWFWFEPDCIPLNERWADELGRDYLTAAATRRPFMGRFLQKVEIQPNGELKTITGEFYMNGAGVYPARLDRVGKLWAHAQSVPFDVLMQWETSNASTPTEKILHNHATGEYTIVSPGVVSCKTLTEPTRSLTTFEIPKSALVFHGCKDTSLIEIVRSGQLYAEKVQEEEKAPEPKAKGKKRVANFSVEDSTPNAE